MFVHNERNTKTILRQWAEVAKTDLLHSFLILYSIGSPYQVFLTTVFASFLSRGCIRVRFLRLNFLTFQKNEYYSASYDPLSY